MPDRIPLEPPPGDGPALEELVRKVGAAARCLAEVDDRLIGARACAPGWLGDDAAAAATQIATVAALVRAASDTALPVAGRLGSHAELLLVTRRQIERLRDEQDEQFRHAYRRWYALPDLQAQIMTDGPEVRAIVAELEAGEVRRRRQHSALLEDLADDAAATARVLGDACAVVGGHGRPGEPNDVIAYLAGQLPGWGDHELARQGQDLARRLTGAATPEERTEWAAEAAPFRSQPAFAGALLAGLGQEGVTYLLRFLGDGAFHDDTAVAELLAASFGAAEPSGAAGDRVCAVLDGEYVPAGDRYGDGDRVAAGLATVLAAGMAMPNGGVQTRTVAEWSRQLLLREREQREPVGRRSGVGAPGTSDPVALAVGILARRADPDVSASLLADTRIWEALLERVWEDGGKALDGLIGQAGLATGAPAEHAVRVGLATIGAGLAADDPARWTVNRDTVGAVARPLGQAVSGQVEVAVDALRIGVDGIPSAERRDLLAGLGSLTLDPVASAAIEDAIAAWARTQPTALDGDASCSPPPAVGVLGAYTAVRELAQRTDHALDAMEDRELAENKQWLWGHSVALVPELIPGAWGLAAGVVEGGLAIALDMDGTWEDRPDRGLVFDRADAASLATAVLSPQGAPEFRAVTDQAEVAFARTVAALGERQAPTSPETDWLAPGEDLGRDMQEDRREHERRWLPRLPMPR